MPTRTISGLEIDGLPMSQSYLIWMPTRTKAVVHVNGTRQSQSYLIWMPTRTKLNQWSLNATVVAVLPYLDAHSYYCTFNFKLI